MLEFAGRVAVVTGAASGIGFALAAKFGAEGMKVVLADIENDDLDQATKDLRARGYDATGVVTDVSKLDQVQALADETLQSYGAVHLLCNNAGVGLVEGDLWECSIKDYEWVLGVNLWGVIWGVRTFVPIMLAQDTDCHIVNTSSMAGLLSGGGVYAISKHGICSLSESLYQGLARRGARIGVSVLLPGITATNLWDSARHRPPDLSDQRAAPHRVAEARDLGGDAVLAIGQSAALIAEKTFDCIRKKRFWIVPNERYTRPVMERVARVFSGEYPIAAEEQLRGFGQPDAGW